MSMEEFWNHTDRGKPKQYVKNLSNYHFFYYESHMNYTDIEPTPLR